MRSRNYQHLLRYEERWQLVDRNQVANRKFGPANQKTGY